MKATKSANINVPDHIIPLLPAIVFWLLHLLPFLLPEARLWGFNHLRFLSPVFFYLYLIGGVFSLSLIFPPLRDIGAGIYNAAAAMLFEEKIRLRWLALAVAALIIFWLGRLPVFLLGDSYSIIENIGNDLPVIFKWSEIGSIYLAYFISKILPITGSRLGEYAYGIISVLSGAATVYIFCALAYELGKDAAARFFIFCLSIFAGWMVLFLGYTENYPVLWPFMTGYIYFAIRYINKKGGLWPPTLMLLVALALHLQVLFFLISYPVLLVTRGTTARLFRKYRTLFWIIAAAAAAVFAILFVRMYQNSLELRLYIIPLLQGHPTSPDYTLFSISHFADIINQFLLLTPLLPVLAVIGWRGWRPLLNNKIDLFLLLLSVGGIAFILAIDPKLGMGRDWDLFALVGLPPLLLFVKNAADGHKLRAVMFPSLTCLALIMAMPFVATNLIRQPAIDNYKYLLNLDLPKSRSGIVILRALAAADNDSLLLDSLKNVLVATYPAVRLSPRAHDLADQGRYREAMILADSMALYEPHSIEVYNLRGLINLRQGKYAQAVQDLEMAAKLGRYDVRPLASLASAYNHLRQVDRMMDALRRGQKRDPKSQEIMIGLMAGFYAMRQYDSAMVYAQKIMQVQPTFANAYWVAGQVYFHAGDRVRAKIHLTRFVEMAPDDPNRQNAVELLQQLE